MSRKIIGLDIKNESVSAVLISRSLKGIQIEASAEVPLSDQGLMEESVAKALHELADAADISGAACIASLPASLVSFRNLQVPFKEEKKIRQVLPFELEPALPLQVEDLVIDFSVLGITRRGENTDLFATAVEKTKIQSLLDTLQEHRLEPEIVTVNGYPTALALAASPLVPENWLFIDGGDRSSTLYIATSGKICMARSIDTNLADSASFCADVTRTLSAFHENSGLELRPECVFTTGFGTGSQDFENEIAEQLAMPVKRFRLLENGEVQLFQAPFQSLFDEDTTNSLALTLLETGRQPVLNFRRGPFAPRRRWAEHKKQLIATGVLAFAVLFLLFLNLYIETSALETRTDVLTSRVTNIFMRTFPDVKRIEDPVHQMRVKVDRYKKSAVLPAGVGSHPRTIDILDELSKRIPNKIDVVVTRLVINPDSVMLTGKTDTFNSVDTIKSRLEKSSLLKTVTITSANLVDADTRILFKLKVVL
jgi:type II secretory pathway component PulL